MKGLSLPKQVSAAIRLLSERALITEEPVPKVDEMINNSIRPTIRSGRRAKIGKAGKLPFPGQDRLEALVSSLVSPHSPIVGNGLSQPLAQKEAALVRTRW